MRTRTLYVIVPCIVLVVTVGYTMWRYKEKVVQSSDFSADARIVFSADFDNGSGCAAHKSDGCDLYTADINFKGEVRNVVKVTSTGAPEAFGVFSADGLTVYASRHSGAGRGDIVWAATDGSAEGTLLKNALGPALLPDGKTLVYVSVPAAQITMADFSDAHTLTNIRTASDETGFHEPHASAAGVVMYRLFGAGRGSNTAQAVVFNPDTKTISPLTSADGTAHCFWGGDGSSATCNNAERYRGLFSAAVAGAPNGVSSLLLGHPTVKEVSVIDSDFASCKGTSYAYGTFCDADHLIITVGCGVEADGVVDTTMSKLGLVDFSPGSPELIPLGKNLAESFGGSGSSSYTVGCQLQ